MYQDERTITPNNETDSVDPKDYRIKIIIKNTSSYDFEVDQTELESGQFISFEPIGPCATNEPDKHALGTCQKGQESLIIYEKYNGKGPKGTLAFKAKGNETAFYFKLYFDLSWYYEENPRCAYIYQQGDYSMASTGCCFLTPGYYKNFTSEITIFDPVLCNNFYHVSDTHFENNLEGVKFAYIFDYVHRRLFDRINSDDQALGLIHTGDICYEDQHFEDYKKYYLKAGNVRDDFKPKYLKNLYEGYGNHDKSDVIDQIKQRHINARGYEKNSYDQCICDDYDSENYLHYFWTWHGVRFIHLNLAPIDEKDNDGHEGYKALSYLKTALTYTGDQMPVILCFHYLIDSEYQDKPGYGFLSEQQIKDFWDAIKDYNICAIICGHLHGVGQPYFSFVYNKELYTTNIRSYFSAIIPCRYKEKVKEKEIEGYRSYYYRFQFDDENKIIKAYYYKIKIPDEAEPHELDFHIEDIDITAGKKPTCDVKPAIPEED